MAFRPPRFRLSLLLLVWGCSLVSAFLLDNADTGDDETLSQAFAAIQHLNGKLNDVMDENQRLKERLQQAEAAQSSHAQLLSQVQTDVTAIGGRLSRDFIWVDDDWMLAFRATAGIGQPVYDAWTHKGHHDDDPMSRQTLPCGCTTVNGSLPCDRHYRSRLLDIWPSASIDQVRLVLYKNGVEKEHVTFTGTGSDYVTWFSQSRIVESSWADLKTATGLNIFSIAGDSTELRRFFISHVYHGCPEDAGWMVVKDRPDDTCTWATVPHAPAFLYAPSNHELVWEKDGFQQADVMAVLVKLRPAANLNEVCLN
ncbi:uncharacterized protein LOC143298123 [Babylonia areolata]|uniref:uncharacterized protein LOC143298123 n=1 Tax=Babylonia areolata TaxID=304850 RepID=UPI003FD0A814